MQTNRVSELTSKKAGVLTKVLTFGVRTRCIAKKPGNEFHIET